MGQEPKRLWENLSAPFRRKRYREPEIALPEEQPRPRWNSTTKVVVGVIAFVLLAVALYLFRIVFVPLIIGVMMAYILQPVVRLIQRITRLPHGTATGLMYLILLALVVSAPSVRARMESWVGSWFSFSSPDGEDFAAIGGFSAFTPYHATYLPEGFQHSGTGTITGWPDYEALELTYDHKNGQFFTLLESTGGDARALPSGEELQVGDSRAVFISNFATSSAELVAKIPILSIVSNFDYSNTNMLTWFMGEVKIEMFSNLPEDEMIRIAASLVPMQTSEGEQPKPPN